MTQKHRAVFINNESDKQGFISALLRGSGVEGFEHLKGYRGDLFSKLALDRFIEEEEIHDSKILTANTSQTLRSMSSGERKKALLTYLLKSAPDFLILDNPFDNLDMASQEALKHTLEEKACDVVLIQIISRKKDLLPFIKVYYSLKGNQVFPIEQLEEDKPAFTETLIPGPLKEIAYDGKYLVELKEVSVSYEGTAILKAIDWKICSNEFWQLKGKNGSGKTTLLSMITGDNPKGYGQQIFLFGKLKGSGESIWDIKKMIGYFTPAMVDRFKGYHTLEHMLISGLMDSIGLYIRPTEAQIRLAGEWLELLDMRSLRHSYFHDLSMGQQRIIMCARAMIKHPLLLILDEPTAGLDDASAALFVSLVNKISKESKTAIIFVSHREEVGLKPQFIYTLEMSEKGSLGSVETV
ncbi:MAG: ATP-binding cassette domain-containing protein [Flavobacteriaceae bacterium]